MFRLQKQMQFIILSLLFSAVLCVQKNRIIKFNPHVTKKYAYLTKLMVEFDRSTCKDCWTLYNEYLIDVSIDAVEKTNKKSKTEYTMGHVLQKL